MTILAALSQRPTSGCRTTAPDALRLLDREDRLRSMLSTKMAAWSNVADAHLVDTSGKKTSRG
jgi:hypothetical protein